MRIPGVGGRSGGSLTLFSGRWDAAKDEGNLQININPDLTRRIRACLLNNSSQFSIPVACGADTPPGAGEPVAGQPLLAHVLSQAVSRLDPAMATALMSLQPTTTPVEGEAAALQQLLATLLRQKAADSSNVAGATVNGAGST